MHDKDHHETRSFRQDLPKDAPLLPSLKTNKVLLETFFSATNSYMKLQMGHPL